MQFNARRFKRAWSNARLGRGPEDRMVLAGMLVEVFDGLGIRVVTTNSYVLVDTFIPVVGNETRPELDVDPDQTLLVYDPANAFVAPCAGAGPDNQVRLSIVDGALTLSSTHRLAPVTATVHNIEGDFPSWRSLWPKIPKRYDGEFPTFATKTLALAARLHHHVNDGHTGGKVELYGIDHLKPWLFLNPQSEHRLLIMPVRKN